MPVKTKKKKSTQEKYIEVIDNEEKDIVDFDPRRNKFSSYFYDPLSLTYSNAYRSAIRAGYTHEYAKVITYKKPQWLSDIVRNMGFLEKLEKNFEEHINLNPVVQAMGAFGPLFEGKGKDKKPVMVESTTRLKLRQEMTMFGLEKLHPNFRKKEKDDPGGKVNVEIKQIIIIAPNGNQQQSAGDSPDRETIPSIPTA